MAKKKKKRISKVPKFRIWGVPSRKVSTMVISSKKDKLRRRSVRKEILRKEINEK